MRETIALLQEFVDNTGHVTQFCQFCDKDYWDAENLNDQSNNHKPGCLILRAQNYIDAQEVMG